MNQGVRIYSMEVPIHNINAEIGHVIFSAVQRDIMWRSNIRHMLTMVINGAQHRGEI
jgi:hypothetical protein